jgi:hypothetical protein
VITTVVRALTEASLVEFGRINFIMTAFFMAAASYSIQAALALTCGYTRW